METSAQDPRRNQGQMRRLDATDRKKLLFRVNGCIVDALEGDTVLTAILVNRRFLRSFEFAPSVRAGFCLMGACQDCWVRTENGDAIRACSTLVEAGMALSLETVGRLEIADET